MADANAYGPELCHRCGCELHPGRGDFYVVYIEAYADPSPPVIDIEIAGPSLRQQLEEAAEELKDVSPQEAIDQVYRRLTLTLCIPCFRKWIDNPTPG